MKKIVEGIMMITIGMVVIEVVKRVVVIPGTEAFGEGIMELKSKKK